MRLGLQISIAGKIYESIDRALALGCQSMQIFSRNPQSWKISPISQRDIGEFKRRRREAGIFPLFIHIPYLINLASGDDILWQKSVSTYIEDIKQADSLGAEYFVTHLGNHKGRGEAFGIKRFSLGLNLALKEAQPKLMILLENTAGSGSALGYDFEHLGRIIENVKQKEKIGICLDTCHAYAAGYDIKSKKVLDEVLDKIEELIGFSRLKMIHLNDSKRELGSRVDRHEHIGKGKIGLKGFKTIVNHPKLKNLTFILETPKKDAKDDPMNLALVKGLIK